MTGRLIVPFVFVLLAASVAAAQESRVEATEVRPGAEPCETGRISYVFIDNHSIFDTTDPTLDRRFTWAYKLINSLHVPTRRGVIARELLFSPGDCYDPLLLQESERLLRNSPYLSRVDVFGVPQPDGTYHVVVDTQDEWSTQVDVRVRMNDGLRMEGLRVREVNLLGTGQMLGFYYLDRDVRRDYGIAFQTPQLFGSRWRLDLAAGRTRAGTSFDEAVYHPFRGEVGRWAALQAFSREDRYFDYLVGDARSGSTHLLVPLRERSVDLVAMGRFGEPGNLVLLGGGLAAQRVKYPGGSRPLLVSGDDFGDAAPAPDTLSGPISRQLGEIDNLRAILLLGKRNIRWVRRRGLDSMRGIQDVRLGSDAELAVGRSIPFGSMDDDAFAGLRLYGATETGSFLIASRFDIDARRDYRGRADAPRRGSTARWEDVVAEGEFLAYWRPAPDSRQTFVLRLEGVGAWNTRTPFQVTLGGDRGVRGYAPARFPGGQRAVMTFEDRIYFGWPLRDVLDLGGTAFVDVGRVWPGDAPFGMDSGWRASAGIGLRGSLPAGGRTTYRLDLAIPLERTAGLRDLRLIASVGEIIGLSAQNVEGNSIRARRAAVTGRFAQFRD